MMNSDPSIAKYPNLYSKTEKCFFLSYKLKFFLSASDGIWFGYCWLSYLVPENVKELLCG